MGMRGNKEYVLWKTKVKEAKFSERASLIRTLGCTRFAWFVQGGEGKNGFKTRFESMRRVWFFLFALFALFASFALFALCALICFTLQSYCNQP